MLTLTSKRIRSDVANGDMRIFVDRIFVHSGESKFRKAKYNRVESSCECTWVLGGVA